MTYLLKNEIRFNMDCHKMAKENWSLAYDYVTDIFLERGYIIDVFNGPMSCKYIDYKDIGNNIVKAYSLTVRSFLLYIPFINRITQFALRILSPKLTYECFDLFGVKELNIRYSKKDRWFFFTNRSETN